MMVGSFLLGSAHSYCLGQVDTQLSNFFLHGTQPQQVPDNFAAFYSSQECQGCHEPDPELGQTFPPIYGHWFGSMKANATRDPLWKAALAIANQDAPFSGDLCIRCHSPAGWVSGRSTPTDGSALELDGADYEGVTCTVCHRMVDPVLRPENPDEDDPIRKALFNAGMLPTSPGSGNFVLDPNDVRRGPFPYLLNGGPPNVPRNFHGAPIIHSPFHTTSEICATCHDVSNPAMMRQTDGSYRPNPSGVAHPTQDKYDMFPLERTYSEWANSQYATTGVQANGVFGGNHPTGVMKTCQDCHMPDAETWGSNIDSSPFYIRPNVPSHDFAGGNTWVQEMLKNLFFFSPTQEGYLDDSRDRALYMLQNAATVEVTNEGCDINVRVVNETGHKLPTGYPEGRRMWISVDFRDENLNPVVYRGYYHGPSADLFGSDTKVYEAKLGLDAFMAAASGVPEGPSFHFVLNNMVYLDNRIPPRGFTNAAFAAVQAAPIGASYTDGQYWDDTVFRIPPGAVSATVSLYYQTSSKEYIQFLRDENETNDDGEILYVQWLVTGMSPPVLMKQAAVQELVAGVFADSDCSGNLDLGDLPTLDECLRGPAADLVLGCELFDSDLDGDVDLQDMTALQANFLP